MSNFALYTGSSQSDIISSLNYALANLGTGNNIDANVVITIVDNILANGNVITNAIANANVVTANTITGSLSTTHTGTINYLYNYVNVKYADTVTGGGFSSNCTNKSYYGVHNTKDGSISTNPVDYQWYQVVGGFGTTKGLYHTTAGGGIVYFIPGTIAPSVLYTSVVDDQAISLQSLANSIVQTNTINPGAVTNVGIATQTITTNNMAFGIITADLLAANLIIAKDIVSTNANLGNISSPGYWLQANSGSARFGGNVSIGNNLTIGSNAQVGGNATIGSNLNVGSNATIGSNLNVGSNATIGGNATVGSNVTIGDSLTIGNNVSIGNNLTVAGLITAANLNANTVQTTTITQNATSTIGANSVYSGYTVNSPVSGQSYAMGANVTISNAQPGWSFICSAFSTPSLNYSTSAPAINDTAFQLSIIVQDATTGNIINNVTITESVITWVSGAYTNVVGEIAFPGVYMGTNTVPRTLNFWLAQAVIIGSGTPVSFTDGGRGLTVNVAKR
jgi:acetyltransferase-like isoleucine patch superfamily enzyme